MSVDEFTTWPEEWPDPQEKRYALLEESADPTFLAEVVMVTLTASAFTVPLSKVLITWLKTRRSQVRVEVERPDGSKVRIEASNLLDPQVLNKEALEQIDKAQKAEISWTEKKPKSSKKK